MNKRKYAIVVLVIAIFIMIVSTLVIYNSRIGKKKTALSNEINIINLTSIEKIGSNFDEDTKQTSQSEIKISPNAFIKFVKYYKNCGHTVETIEKIPEEFVNKNIDEIKKEYNDWIVTQMDEKQVTLYKEFDEECGEHYLVKDNNGFVSIYKIDSNGNEVLLEPTEIYVQYLPELDREKLKNGVRLTGKEELNAYIEDFE